MTTNDPGHEPFTRDRLVDKPGIAGARWWHEALVDQAAQIKRRDAMRNILIAGGVIAGFGAMLAMCAGAAEVISGSSGPAVSDQRKTSLEMQREYGWAFGAVGEPLVFDGVTTKPFVPGALVLLRKDLAPSQSALVPYFQTALFEAPTAVPPSLSKLDPDEAAGFQALSASVQPIFTPAMDAAYARGASLASLFAGLAANRSTPASANTALLVDLPGPEAAAFAAGAAKVFDPVFLFDNWPHPRGVVRAQETLSAAAYYQPLFAEARSASSGPRPPMFVLDRRRLAAYTDDATQFDNRYTAKLPPSAAAMRGLGVSHILYVVPTRADATRELDDLNDELVLYAGAGLDVKALSLDMFQAESGVMYYGGSAGSHHAFFVDYPWAKPAQTATTRPASNPGTSYAPQPRVSPYSSGAPTATTTTRPRPTNFGTVPVVVALGTGLILGARYSRSGSWNRSSGSSSGG